MKMVLGLREIKEGPPTSDDHPSCLDIRKLEGNFSLGGKLVCNDEKMVSRGPENSPIYSFRLYENGPKKTILMQ